MLLAALTARTTATGAGFDGVITPKTVETKMLAAPSQEGQTSVLASFMWKALG